MRRVLAVIGAVLIVVGALAVRSMIEGDDDDPSGGDGDGSLVVVCDTDLLGACEGFGAGVDVRIEDSAVTAAALVSGELDTVDGWVTTSAWLEVVRSRAAESVGAAEALAGAPVVIASDLDRAEAIEELCGDDPLWRCVTDAAERSWADLGGEATWGPMRTGLPDADTALGLSVLSSVAVGYFGHADFAANDFTELRGALAKLVDASSPGDRNLLTTLVRRRGTYTAGGFTEPAVGGRTDVAVLPAEPVVDAVAVLVDLTGGDDDADPQRVRNVLVDAGWRPMTDEPSATLKPGVMAALHTLWTETTG